MQSQTFTNQPTRNFHIDLDSMIKRLTASDDHPLLRANDTHVQTGAQAHYNETQVSLSDIDFKLTPSKAYPDVFEVRDPLPSMGPGCSSGVMTSNANAQSLCRMRSPSSIQVCSEKPVRKNLLDRASFHCS
jgi:hypothetical protein